MRPQDGLPLLLTSRLGEPGRKALTTVQYRVLAQRFLASGRRMGSEGFSQEELEELGYPAAEAQRICLLSRQWELLEAYLAAGRKAGCVPLTRVMEGYPQRVRRGLGLDCPGSLWTRGDLSILDMPCVALVGSRDLLPPNEEFARQVGRAAAKQGYALVSGNARGADSVAQDACLEAGGRVISVVADRLDRHQGRHVLYLSEEGFDLDFTARRALSRNRVIHCLGQMTFVAQSGLRGGTWDGTSQNLKGGWSPVYIFQDGSEGTQALTALGATAIQDCKEAPL